MSVASDAIMVTMTWLAVWGGREIMIRKEASRKLSITALVLRAVRRLKAGGFRYHMNRAWELDSQATYDFNWGNDD